MKIIKIILGVLVLTVGVVYIVLFTPINKSIIIPIIEKQASSALKIDKVKVSNFELTTSNLNLTLLLNKEEINLNAKFGLLSSTLDATYDIKIKDLSIFDKVSGQNLNGTFDTKGKIKGVFDNLKLKGDAQVAGGNIEYKLKTKAGDVKDIIVGVQELDLSKLLAMINQPKYAKANINIDMNIKSLSNLDGTVLTTVNDGFLNAILVKRDFNITLPSKPIFDLKATTILAQNLISTKSKLNTFAATVETTKTTFDTITAILNTDYVLSISNLDKLYFITNQKMQGDIKIIGDVKVDKDLYVSFNSNKFDGKIDGTLKDKKLNLNIKDVNSLQLLDMLYYPKIFSSKLNVKLDYELDTKKGVSDILLKDGQFLVSQFSQTIKNLLGKDLTAEIYKITSIKTKINNLKLDNTLFMESKNSQIKSNKLYIDLEKSHLDAILDMKFYGIDLDIEAKGEVFNPEIKVDAGKIIQQKIDEKLDDELKNNLDGLLKGLFK